MLQKKGEPAMNSVTIGMDLGDKNNVVCVVDSKGTIIESQPIENNKESIRSFYERYKGNKVVLEAGTHSPWISRLLSSLGLEVLIGNPRKLRAIWGSTDKCDGRDAEMLARIGRFDPHLLCPINHRGRQAQIDLGLIQARDILVRNRSSLINHVRSSVKSLGDRLPQCSAENFHRQALDHLPAALSDSLIPILTIIEQLSNEIHAFDKKVETLCQQRYQQTELLRAVKGVGPLTALTFVLTLEDPAKFHKSRQVGNFLGLTPRRDQSGEVDKQLRITKTGDPYLRKLLVGSAQYILGAFGEDCNLRRFGIRLSEKGGKNAKRRAVVAVARKLAVLLHRLWRNGEEYDPFYRTNRLLRAKVV